ncbi:MAG: 3-deoxy-D-manno-octulosonic acid transferase [Bacteroidota bacterium]|jgi:3-deoxy-D-manno-octulosonic-acid transferase
MIRIVYNIFINGYFLAIKLASLIGNSKAKKFIAGRSFYNPKYFEGLLQVARSKIIFHCASAGEFEQALPLIKAYRKENPHDYILVSFFSPSGYELNKTCSLADDVIYLPIDTISKTKAFLKAVKPKKIFLSKYDIWPNLILEAQSFECQCILFSSTFRANQIYFQWYGKFFKKVLESFSYIFVQTEADVMLLKSNGLKNKIVCAGDTRYDRVMSIAEEGERIAQLDKASEQFSIIIAGSTWPPDNFILARSLTEALKLNPTMRLLVFPHLLDKASLNEAKTNFVKLKVNLIDHFDELDFVQYQVNIFSKPKFLSKAYASASLAYIGGGFGAGIHNTLEAAVFQIPLVGGPKNKKFVEVQELRRAGLFTEVNAVNSIIPLADLIKNPQIKKAASYFFQDKGQAAKTILRQIK